MFGHRCVQEIGLFIEITLYHFSVQNIENYDHSLPIAITELMSSNVLVKTYTSSSVSSVGHISMGMFGISVGSSFTR